MDTDAFWTMIERVRLRASDPEERLGMLATELSRHPLSEVVEFQICHDRVRERSDTHQMWGAAHRIFDGHCSGDGFWYFQAWLIGLGRAAFERAVADPDTLAEVAEVIRLAGRPLGEWADAEFPEWESFNYLARTTYDEVAGTVEGIYAELAKRGHDTPEDPAPADVPWDFDDPAEVAERLPRLATLFPLPGGNGRGH
ncbi:DUF4240 domain-containing protein [Actinomadura craniellae]|uniref:DUF4240 domain-containing protein n=1 Tax=Actinomadura craniellae TaxID=2231787 RepID=A0A365H6P9_9ACTN|nr:DUF4240 domain-containing protein [Actinomadura craniellae]RAY14672.1 DUF4240 domain-containing protein [Actinomadura craniellae]